MRLIDADETIRIWDGCGITGSITPIINARPTVEAIPIDWIESQVDKGKWSELVQRWTERKEE